MNPFASSWPAFVAGCVVPGLVVTWLAGFAVRRFAPAWGLVDRPGPRKEHAAPTPSGGGIAIWLGVLLPALLGQIALALIARGNLPVTLVPEVARPHLVGFASESGRLSILLAAGTAMLVLGLIDDRRGLDWRVRLAVQTAIAAIVVGQGLRLTAFIDLPLVTGALSVVWIVGLVNSFNMLDNMDGLSAGVAAIAAAILAAVLLAVPEPAGSGPQLFVAGLLLMLVGPLVGFLWHNWPPARLFMGDGGSYFVGFSMAVATLAATFTGGGVPRHAILAPLCVLAIPIYDTLTVLAIRLREGRSPFEGDTSHFSHRLVELGLSRRHAVWTIYLASATCGLAAFFLPHVDRFGAILVVLMVCCVLTIIGILETAARRRGRGEGE